MISTVEIIDTHSPEDCRTFEPRVGAVRSAEGFFYCSNDCAYAATRYLRPHRYVAGGPYPYRHWCGICGFAEDANDLHAGAR